LSVPICININDEEVERSKTLDKYSIVEIISKYNKELASEINKMSICKIEHPKTKKAYIISIKPLTEAYDSDKKYFNDKFKQYYKLNQDIVNIVICHSLKRLWIGIYYGSHKFDLSKMSDDVISKKKDDKNVISNELDDKPKQINLLDLNKYILNIIGGL
jgi:hypothetical protein